MLARSVKAAHPDWQMHALLVDRLPPDLPQADPLQSDLSHADRPLAEAFAPFDHVLTADRLGIPDFAGWMFKHDLVEACTAVKPPMLLALLEQGFDKVVYLDPDIAVFHDLGSIERRLDDASIVLTPHQSVPSRGESALRDNEMTSLQYGIYNLGFVAVRNDANGRGFAQWWTRMTRRACYDDVASGIFTDQKYCDLVPGLFDRVAIERDPGCNVASWNLADRRLRFAADGRLMANDATLKFYHFTKIGGIGDTMTERHAQAGCEVFEIVNWYKRQVHANGVPALSARPWHYAAFADAVPIPRGVRLLWRERPDLHAAFADPFAAEGDCLQGWLRRERPDLLA